MPVGPSPFSQDFPEWYERKRHSSNKKEMKGLQAGYPTRKLRSNLTGDVYMLPRQDYEELVKYFGEHQSELSEGYNNGKQLYRKIHTPADFIDYAFEKKSQQKNIVTQECKSGHIKALSYNALYMLLMVEFTNRGDVVVFFNLPANVASTLMYLAENDTMAVSPVDGTQRHAVGVQFWNLVRVRGTIHETRFPFQYTKDFRTGEAFGRREGAGVHGEGNKYDYFEAEPQRRRFDKKTGEEIIRETVQVRARKDKKNRHGETDVFKREEDALGQNQNVYEYTIDDFADYFEDLNKSVFDKHRAMAGASKSMTDKLNKALAIYESGDGSKEALDKMSALLASTGFDFPPANPDYL